MSVHPSEHPSIAHFRLQHRRLGGTGEIVLLPDVAHTAVLAAQALGCEVGAIANSLIFEAVTDDEADGSPVLVLTSGAHRVDTTRLAATIGVTALRRASATFVRTHTGQAIGGVSPLAHPSPLPTYLDSWLRAHRVVWAAAGHPAAVFSTTYDELLGLTAAIEVHVD